MEEKIKNRFACIYGERKLTHCRVIVVLMDVHPRVKALFLVSYKPNSAG